ncbi:hypothetical protein [Streptomyces chromofuscus]|uniref:Uncharacterized protein n=1 Tax=Streptomyces chromofuscus TaxID=42881 RepID=A0A7M2T7E8_STRCW|nr:hypothetical protein [Streptomyces chromofuscus]QOV44626.1 hypothetical protein IPT68_00845 [Streptomyces chromofuscus]GGT01748.1 hypothetical protein GCM10010254_22570 [Streptomyces chromofuscus]
MTTLSPGGQPPVSTPRPSVHVYNVVGTRTGGDILVVLTGSRADQDAAAHAGRLAAGTGAQVTAAVAVRSTGFIVNALLHHARAQRFAQPTDAVPAARTDTLIAPGPHRFNTLVLPCGNYPHLSLPAGAVHRLARRTGATTVITPVPVHNAAGHLAHVHPGAGPPVSGDRLRQRGREVEEPDAVLPPIRDGGGR